MNKAMNESNYKSVKESMINHERIFASGSMHNSPKKRYVLICTLVSLSHLTEDYVDPLIYVLVTGQDAYLSHSNHVC